MDAPRRAAAGFALVALAQLCYLYGAMTFGGPGIGALVDLVSIACAGVCAVALYRATDAADARTPLAWSLSVLAGVQVAELATSLYDGAGPFLVGFVLVVAGLLVAARGAWTWCAAALRWGPALVSLGSLSYLALGIANGLSVNVFSVGAVAAAAGWCLVALA